MRLEEINAKSHGVLNILVIHNSKVDLKLYQKLLNNKKRNILTASSRKEALERLEKHEIALVLLDSIKSDKDGIEIAQEIFKKQGSKSVSIIFINELKSGHDEVLKNFELGTVDYIVKPFDNHTLQNKVHIFCNQHQQTELLRLKQIELEDSVRALKGEIESNREKDRLMFRQAKLAQMGEMISMIAHQWRQPLVVISSAAINLIMKDDLGVCNSKDIKECSETVQGQTQNLSKIIDEFINFTKPAKLKEVFSLKKIVDNIAKMMSPQLLGRNIKITNRVEENIELMGYPKELEQVLLNLFSNARDAHEGSLSAHKYIEVVSENKYSSITLYVRDNAGGIAHNIIDRIFNPYFTTKEEEKGTGIGLYMSKRIVEHSFKGRMHVLSQGDKTEFLIHIPKGTDG